ncbi:MAG: hypothetical protein ACYDEQ_13445 [Desulfocucumaceae bacterium]
MIFRTRGRLLLTGFLVVLLTLCLAAAAFASPEGVGLIGGYPVLGAETGSLSSEEQQMFDLVYK